MKFQVVKVSDYGDYNPEPPCSGAKSEFVKVLSEIYVDGESAHYKFCSGERAYLTGDNYPIWTLEAATLEELRKLVDDSKVIIEWGTPPFSDSLDLKIDGRIKIYDSWND